MKSKQLYILLALVLAGSMLVTFQCQSTKKTVSYNQHIRPIINTKCIACHGGVKKQGDLSFLFREEAITTGASGARSIVPGSPAKSELVKRLIHEDPEKRMPQEAEPLTSEEIKLFRQWIKEGAEWEDHWAYVAPEEPIIPQQTEAWVKQPMDHFVLNQMKEANWSPADQASAHVLVRRLFLDITGLPPTVEDYKRYVYSESPLNFEAIIDELLQSPAYGEKWASFWLDLARYADSKGYEKDPHRSIWKYRDWVIEAFNRDMPFDQFTTEQIAGDLLPNPTESQLIATAFHRNTMTNTEGGTDDEEFRIASVIDRVNTTFEVWQSTTMSCVQCHSHPYDPFRHEEFYQFMGILNNTKDNDLNVEYPNLESYAPEQLEEVESLIEYIENLKGIEIEDNLIVSDKIQKALEPTLWMRDCDDVYNSILYGDFMLSNWGNNVNDAINRKFYFRFEDINMDGLEYLTYSYSAKSGDVKMELRLDSIRGPLISSTQLPESKSVRSAEWVGRNTLTQHKTTVKPVQGKHDLIFEIINTTGRVPEGIVMLQKIELGYKDYEPSKKLLESQNGLYALRKEAILTPITLERSSAFGRENHVFERGNFLLKGTAVNPMAPEVLSAGLESKVMSRLDMAQWLVSPEHPLTARVVVNRIWEQIFGRGIVETLEDFGTMGSPPSHPELLDYLAYSFIHEDGWSIKSLLKRILTSATYQQSSKASKKKYEEDPQNIYLARGPRFRLSSEQLRDQGLALSGLLSDRIGGKSVMPYQPDGIWQVVYNSQNWEIAQGQEKYRRALYTYWKRTSPYPSMMTFDNPSREYCVSRRIRTNTPLQALVTLNDPVFIEIANAFARRMKQAAPDNLDAQIKYGVLAATGIQDNPGIHSTLRNLYEQSVEFYRSQEVKAQFISHTEIDEPAIQDPLSVVANAILNLDQVLTKE